MCTCGDGILMHAFGAKENHCLRCDCPRYQPQENVTRDDAYWDEVEAATGKGTRSTLWGASTRSLRRGLAWLRRQYEEAGHE